MCFAQYLRFIPKKLMWNFKKKEVIMKRFCLFLAVNMLASVTVFAQYDDIYFNPKTDIKTVKITVSTTSSAAATTTVSVTTTADPDISLTEEDYTYTNRLNKFHNKNLLVHIDGNDTTIYDIENGRYIVSVGDDVEIEPYNAADNSSVTNVYVNNYDYDYGWNSWYRPYRYYYGYAYYDPWYWSYYDAWYRPWYYYHPYAYCHHHHHHHHHPVYHKPHHGGGSNHNVGNNYAYASNETYRLQHNSAGRYGGTRTAVGSSSTSTSSRGATIQSSSAPTRTQATRSEVVRDGNGRSTATPAQTSGTRQTVRVSSDEGVRSGATRVNNVQTTGGTTRQSVTGTSSGTRSSATSTSQRSSSSSSSTTRSNVQSTSRQTQSTSRQTQSVSRGTNTSTRSSSVSSGRSSSSSSSGTRSSSSVSSGSRGGGSVSSGSRGGGSSNTRR